MVSRRLRGCRALSGGICILVDDTSRLTMDLRLLEKVIWISKRLELCKLRSTHGPLGVRAISGPEQRLATGNAQVSRHHCLKEDMDRVSVDFPKGSKTMFHMLSNNFTSLAAFGENFNPVYVRPFWHYQ